MSLEIALRQEIKNIPVLKNKIYPTNAPKDKAAPYLVYAVQSTPLKDLNGYENSDVESHVLLNIFGNSYSEMKELTKTVKDIVKTFPFRAIGQAGPFIENLTFDATAETYENELNLYRGIIPFTISYKEEE